jgi:hypothetical protein
LGTVKAECPAGAYGTCTIGQGTAEEHVGYYYDDNGFTSDNCTSGGGVWAVP